MNYLDNLVVKDASIKSFEELKNEYFNNNKRLEEIKDDINKLKIKNPHCLSLEDAHNIYWILGLSKTQLKVNIDVDIDDLKNRFTYVIPGLQKYMELLRTQKMLKDRNEDLLSEYIDFEHFDNSNCEHNFIKYNGYLICVKCLSSTKYYNLNPDDVDFLELCAKKQHVFLTDVKEKDLPLYYNLWDEHCDFLSQMDKNDPDYSEKRYFVEESALSEITRKIKIANMMDRKEYKLNEFRGINPEYLNADESRFLLDEVNKNAKEIRESNPKNLSLLLELCAVIRYEILILRGNSIFELYESIEKDENQVIALSKAYYNLSSPERRIKSGYFKDEKDAVWYECLTADPHINYKIKKMKSRE